MLFYSPYKPMNTIDTIQQLINDQTNLEVSKELEVVWDGVWTDHKVDNYSKLRLFKALDKIAYLVSLGVDFKDKTVLDIGCGDGTMLKYLNKHYGIKGIGVDISPEVISKLYKTEDVQFMVGDHRNLSGIENDSVDIVISLGVIEHFEEYLLAIAEARRVLVTGGVFIMIQPHLFSFGVLQEYWLKLTRRWKFGNQKDFSYLYYRKMLSRLGFKKIIVSTRPPYHDMWRSRLLDKLIKKVFPNWGHYLYLISYK